MPESRKPPPDEPKVVEEPVEPVDDEGDEGDVESPGLTGGGMSEQQIRDAGLAVDVPYETGAGTERLRYAPGISETPFTGPLPGDDEQAPTTPQPAQAAPAPQPQPPPQPGPPPPRTPSPPAPPRRPPPPR